MKKQCILRALIGAPVGLSVSIIITIIISLCTGKGDYYPAPHELMDFCGTPMNAVLLQTFCSLLYGAIFGAASVIWEIESFSLSKQTILHFLIISISSFPIAYGLYWIPHHIYGALGYIGLFLGVYLIIWLSLYFSIKYKIKKLNSSLSSKN